MLDFKTKEERQAWGKHGEYKGHIYRKSDNILFVESMGQIQVVIGNKVKKVYDEVIKIVPQSNNIGKKNESQELIKYI